MNARYSNQLNFFFTPNKGEMFYIIFFVVFMQNALLSTIFITYRNLILTYSFLPTFGNMYLLGQSNQFYHNTSNKFINNYQQ